MRHPAPARVLTTSPFADLVDGLLVIFGGSALAAAGAAALEALVEPPWGRTQGPGQGSVYVLAPLGWLLVGAFYAKVGRRFLSGDGFGAATMCTWASRLIWTQTSSMRPVVVVPVVGFLFSGAVGADGLVGWSIAVGAALAVAVVVTGRTLWRRPRRVGTSRVGALLDELRPEDVPAVQPSMTYRLLFAAADGRLALLGLTSVALLATLRGSPESTEPMKALLALMAVGVVAGLPSRLTATASDLALRRGPFLYTTAYASAGAVAWAAISGSEVAVAASVLLAGIAAREARRALWPEGPPDFAQFGRNYSTVPSQGV